MIGKIGNACSYLLLLPLALLSLYIYKLALQPAVHQFYKLEPNVVAMYGLVLVAALVHAVLLASVVLKYYSGSLRLVSMAMTTLVLVYCIQMAWLSPLAHLLFWSIVFVVYVVVWASVLWLGLQFVVDDEEPQAFAQNGSQQAHTVQ